MFELDEQKAADDILDLHCLYCDKQLIHKSQTSYPYKDVPSIDHMKPHYMGGTEIGVKMVHTPPSPPMYG